VLNRTLFDQVPRSGLKFGVDFVLYKYGPQLYHAHFSVMVKCSNAASCSADLFGFQWSQLQSVLRTTQNVAKELLICTVTIPSKELLEKASISSALQSCSVQCEVIKQWEASRDRNKK